MKKVFWIPQLATVDKVTGKTIINADSNMTILNGIIENMPDDYSFYVFMPAERFCNCSFHKAITANKDITFLESSTKPISAFSLRYDFDFSEMMSTLDMVQPDFIVNNTPSLTRNLKAVLFMLKSKMKNQPKLINFLHFLDYPGEDKVPKEISYFMRQVEGILCSDLAVFQSFTVRDKALFAIDEYFSKIKEFMNPNLKSSVWNATYSQSAIDKFKNQEKFEKKTIMFPNRLSSTNYSNHLRFFEAIRNISKQRNDFQVIVNNPTQYMSYDEISKLCPNLKILNNGNLLDRELYLKTLHQVDIGVALFVQEGHGGVSSKEFQAAGCLPVFPQTNEYQYLMLPDYKGFCKIDLSDLENSINYTLDVCRTKEGNDLKIIGKRMIFQRDSFEFNIRNVKKDFDELC
jgi:hypothetical protein